MTERAAVAIYRELLLPFSETFIAEQAHALTRYRPFYVGLARVAGSLIAAEEDAVVAGGSSRSVGNLMWKAAGLADRRWLRDIAARAPALVHAHFGRDALRGLVLARLMGVPALATFHGYDATVLPPWSWRHGCSALRWRWYRRRLRVRLTGGLTCIAVSRFIRDRLLALGAPSDRVHVRYIGVDLDTLDEPLRHRIEHRGARVLFVGRLVEKKGCGDLLAACARVAATRALELTVIGDGPLRPRLEAMAREVLPTVRFLGAQPPVVVRAELARARVFCGPSKRALDGDAEGLGMVFLEAQAMGVPVVSYRSGGIPEAVADGSSGDLVAEGDVEGLAAAIVRLLGDDDRWLRMSVAGRCLVATTFDVRTCTRALESLYDEVVATPDTPELRCA